MRFLKGRCIKIAFQALLIWTKTNKEIILPNPNSFIQLQIETSFSPTLKQLKHQFEVPPNFAINLKQPNRFLIWMFKSPGSWPNASAHNGLIKFAKRPAPNKFRANWFCKFIVVCLGYHSRVLLPRLMLHTLLHSMESILYRAFLLLFGG